LGNGGLVVSVGAIVEGFILAFLFTVLLTILGFGTVLVLPAVMIGFLLAGIVVGYISNGTTIDGVINGALMGIAGAIILWILSLFNGIAALSLALLSYVPLNSLQEILFVIVVGAVGGAVGALILRFKRKKIKVDRRVREDRDRRDNKYWRD
jgi:hypothetical protein